MKRFYFCALFWILLNNSVFSQQDTSYVIQDTSYVVIDTVSKTKIDSLLNFAKTFIGLPYRYGGTTPAGFDCSGFVRYNFSQFGIHLNRTATEQYRHGIPISKHETKPGDLVFFREKRNNGTYYISHVGIVVSANHEDSTFRFIHSSRRGVIIDPNLMEYYQKRFYGLRRIVNFDENEPVILHENLTETHAPSNLDTIKNPPATPEPKATRHIVQKGDTLYSIAKRYGTSVKALCKLNKLKENSVLSIGQRIKLN